MVNENEGRFELPPNHLFITLTKEESAHLNSLGFNATYNPFRYKEWEPSFERSLNDRTVFILQEAGCYEANQYSNVLSASIWFIPYQKVVPLGEVGSLTKDELLEAVRKSFLQDENFGKPGTNLKITTLKEIYQYEPPEFIVTGIVVKGCSHLLTGAQGDGKSILSLEIGKSILTGGPLFGKYTVNEQGPVLIVDEENPGSLLRDRAKKMGLDENLPLHFLHFQEVRVDNDGCFNSLMTMIEKVNPVLVMYDSLIRIHRQDENISSQMALVMGRIRMIANRGFTCWIIHHQGHPKSGPNRSKSRGSTDIVAGVDLEYSIKKSGDILTLESGKTRIEKFGPVKLNFRVTDDKMQITYAGESRGEFDDAVRSEILATLKHGGKKMIFDEVREDLKYRAKIGIGENKLRSILNELYKEGTINRGEQKDGKKRQFVFWV